MAHKRVLGNSDATKSSPIPLPVLNGNNRSKPVLSKAHFHLHTPNSRCSICDISIKSNYYHCPKCGLLFCSKHQPRFDMTLNRNLDVVPYNENDPNSTSVKCCSICLYNSEGWLLASTGGIVNDKTNMFNELRGPESEQSQLNTLILERRIEKLITWISNQIHVQQHANGVKLDYIKLRSFETGLCTWDEGNTCEICNSGFGLFSRKHHCRLCGNTVCGDITRGCSMSVPLNMFCEIMEKSELSDLLQEDNNSIRICKNCKKSVLVKRVFQSNLKKQSKSIVCQLIMNWRTLENLLDREDLSVIDSNKQSNRLVGLFGRVDTLVKEISRLIESPNGIQRDEVKMLLTLRLMITEYVQEKLLIFRKAQEDKLKREQQLLKEMNGGDEVKPKLLKKDIRELREKLMVLTEQRFIVQNMHEDLKKQRKFEDLRTLDGNIEDLNKEIEDIQRKLGDEAF